MFLFSFFFFFAPSIYSTIASAIKYLETILPVSDRRLASTGWKERNGNAVECFPRSPSTWLEIIRRSGTINTVNANDLYESFRSCFRLAIPHTFFHHKDCVIYDNIFSINAYIHTHIHIYDIYVVIKVENIWMCNIGKWRLNENPILETKDRSRLLFRIRFETVINWHSRGLGSSTWCHEQSYFVIQPRKL